MELRVENVFLQVGQVNFLALRPRDRGVRGVVGLGGGGGGLEGMVLYTERMAISLKLTQTEAISVIYGWGAA